jgi:hypothetical protein
MLAEWSKPLTRAWVQILVVFFSLMILIKYFYINLHIDKLFKKQKRVD